MVSIYDRKELKRMNILESEIQPNPVEAFLEPENYPAKTKFISKVLWYSSKQQMIVFKTIRHCAINHSHKSQHKCVELLRIVSCHSSKLGPILRQKKHCPIVTDIDIVKAQRFGHSWKNGKVNCIILEISQLRLCRGEMLKVLRKLIVP